MQTKLPVYPSTIPLLSCPSPRGSRHLQFGVYLEWHWRKHWHLTLVLLPGKPHGRRSLVGCSPWGRQESDRLNDFTFTFHFHALEKAMAPPLQYSCLENSIDGGAWQAAVHGVARSWTRLSDFTFTHWRRKWQPTPVFLPGESQEQRSLMGCRLWGRTESDTTEAAAVEWHLKILLTSYM